MHWKYLPQQPKPRNVGSKSMQSIINNNGFGFCKASGFRNCNNCINRIRCIAYAPMYGNELLQSINVNTFSQQNKRTLDQSLEDNTQLLAQENAALKSKIQDLESQILNLSQNKNTEQDKTTQTIIQQETSNMELQVYENKNLEPIQQQETTLLKPKRGILGTKFVEDSSKKK